MQKLLIALLALGGFGGSAAGIGLIAIPWEKLSPSKTPSSPKPTTESPTNTNNEIPEDSGDSNDADDTEVVEEPRAPETPPVLIKSDSSQPTAPVVPTLKDLSECTSDDKTQRCKDFLSRKTYVALVCWTDNELDESKVVFYQYKNYKRWAWESDVNKWEADTTVGTRTEVIKDKKTGYKDWDGVWHSNVDGDAPGIKWFDYKQKTDCSKWEEEGGNKWHVSPNALRGLTKATNMSEDDINSFWKYGAGSSEQVKRPKMSYFKGSSGNKHNTFVVIGNNYFGDESTTTPLGLFTLKPASV